MLHSLLGPIGITWQPQLLPVGHYSYDCLQLGSQLLVNDLVLLSTKLSECFGGWSEQLTPCVGEPSYQPHLLSRLIVLSFVFVFFFFFILCSQAKENSCMAQCCRMFRLCSDSPFHQRKAAGPDAARMHTHTVTHSVLLLLSGRCLHVRVHTLPVCTWSHTHAHTVTHIFRRSFLAEACM